MAQGAFSALGEVFDYRLQQYRNRQIRLETDNGELKTTLQNLKHSFGQTVYKLEARNAKLEAVQAGLRESLESLTEQVCEEMERQSVCRIVASASPHPSPVRSKVQQISRDSVHAAQMSKMKRARAAELAKLHETREGRCISKLLSFVSLL